MTPRQISAANSSAERPAWRRTDRSVPRANSLWSGTITTLPFVWRSLMWLPRWLVCSNPTLPRIGWRLFQRRPEAPDSRRKTQCRNDRRFQVFRQGFVLEVELESFFEVCKGLLSCLALARDLNVQAPCHVPGVLVGNRCREFHRIHRIGRFAHRSDLQRGDPGQDPGGPWVTKYEPLPHDRRPQHRPRLTGRRGRSISLRPPRDS